MLLLLILVYNVHFLQRENNGFLLKEMTVVSRLISSLRVAILYEECKLKEAACVKLYFKPIRINRPLH